MSSRNPPPQWGGALRGDTKNGCVADWHTYTDRKATHCHWMQQQSHCILSTIKGRTIRKVMGGGEGNFRAAGMFFRYQIPCMNFFQALA